VPPPTNPGGTEDRRHLQRPNPARDIGTFNDAQQPVQPVQLSLLPKQLPPPPNQLIDQLPPPELARALAQLAHLVAKMTAANRPEAGDE
jgi:hypothetical protein